MKSSLTGTQQKVLALSILAAVTACVVSLLLVPVWLVHVHYDETMVRLENRLAVLTRESMTEPDLRRRFAELKNRQRSSARYLSSSSASLASAELQGIIKRIAAPNGVEILSTQILPEVQTANATAITVKVRSRGTLSELIKTFMSIERGALSLHLDQMSVRNRKVNRLRPKAPQTLDADFNLVGFMRAAS